MEKKRITAEMYTALQQPLPPKAVQPHPTKTFLSTIKAIYVIERLNEVFGPGMWTIRNKVVREDSKHIVVKSALTFEEYHGYLEAYGGNDNPDLGDAYKGACTDALTKIGSFLGIAMEVFKGEGNKPKVEVKPAAVVAFITPEQVNKLKELAEHDLVSPAESTVVHEMADNLKTPFQTAAAAIAKLTRLIKERETA